MYFCSSFTSISQILEIISGIDNNKEVIIFVSEESIYSLFQKIKLDRRYEIIYCPELNYSVASNRPDIVFRYYLIYRKIYKKYFSKIKNQNIYFFSHLYWDFGLKIIQDLSKNNKIYFYNTFPYLEKEKNERLPVFWLRLIFGLKFIRVIKRELCYCSLITRKFIIKNRINLFSPIVDEKKLNNLKKDIFHLDINKYKILILLGGQINENYVDKVNYIKGWNEIISYLLSFYKKEEILVKPHPRIPEDIPSLKPYINHKLSIFPAELLIHHRTEAIIGGTTTVLGYEKPYLRSPLRISTINFNNMYKESREKKIFQNSLNEMPVKICYPENIEQFKSIFKDYLISRKVCLK